MDGDEGSSDMRVIVFHLAGGPHDGVIRSDSLNRNEAKWVKDLFFCLTKRGTVGKAFMSASPAALASLREVGTDETRKRRFTMQKYRVVARKENAHEVHVFAEHFVDPKSPT